MRRLNGSANLRYLKNSEAAGLFAQIVELIEDRFGHNVLFEFFEFAPVYVQIKSQTICYGARQGDNLRYLVFGEQTHLKIEVGVLAVSLGHAILAYEDEGRQKNGFDRGNYAENRKGRIPPGNDRDQAGVYDYPGAEPKQTEIDERYVPSELSSGIGNTHLPSGPGFFSPAAFDERSNVALHDRGERRIGLGGGTARALWMLGGSLSLLHLRGKERNRAYCPFRMSRRGMSRPPFASKPRASSCK